MDHEFLRAQWTGFKSSGGMAGEGRIGDTQNLWGFEYGR